MEANHSTPSKKESLPDPSMQTKFRYLEEGGFYKLHAVNTSAPHTTLIFQCILCAPKFKTLSVQIYSMGNLGRHIEKLHLPHATEYKALKRTPLKRPATEDAVGSEKRPGQSIKRFLEEPKFVEVVTHTNLLTNAAESAPNEPRKRPDSIGDPKRS